MIKITAILGTMIAAALLTNGTQALACSTHEGPACPHGNSMVTEESVSEDLPQVTTVDKDTDTIVITLPKTTKQQDVFEFLASAAQSGQHCGAGHHWNCAFTDGCHCELNRPGGGVGPRG